MINEYFQIRTFRKSGKLTPVPSTYHYANPLLSFYLNRTMWGVYTNIKKSNINWMVVVTTAHHRTEKGRGQHVLIVEQCTIFTLQFSKLITISVLMQFTQLL